MQLLFREFSLLIAITKAFSHLIRYVLQEAITKATSLEEVQRLEQMLKKGQVPGKEAGRHEQNGTEEVEEEMDED